MQEVLAVTAVLAVLAGLSVPAVERWIRRQRLDAVAVALQADMALARSMAMQRRAVVTVCPSADGRSCQASSNWSNGWISFADADRDGARTEGEPLLSVRTGSASGVVVRLAATDPRYVSYRANGRAHLRTGAFQAGNWLICVQGGQDGLRLLLNAVGRVRLEEVRGVCS
ncbi:GspH/FimT family pseudopilin [Tepidimonas fonticaldi]|uniref:GspH/FimT family pseudopilin n=1 Tax=Tepidimonas fonticaldi TaxID=1101373 RepID=UPI0018D34C8A